MIVTNRQLFGHLTYWGSIEQHRFLCQTLQTYKHEHESSNKRWFSTLAFILLSKQPLRPVTAAWLLFKKIKEPPHHILAHFGIVNLFWCKGLLYLNLEFNDTFDIAPTDYAVYSPLVSLENLTGGAGARYTNQTSPPPQPPSDDLPPPPPRFPFATINGRSFFINGDSLLGWE